MGQSRIKQGFLLLLAVAALFPLIARAEELPFQSGDRVAILGDSVALTAEPASMGLSGMAVSEDEYLDSAIWLAEAQEDGSWIFENPAGRLSLDGETGLLTLDGECDRWVVADLGDGCFLVASRDLGLHLTWYSVMEMFGAAPEKSEGSALHIRVIPEGPGETTEDSTAETTQTPGSETSEETTTETTAETTETTAAPSESQPEASSPDSPGLDTGDWNLYFGQLHAHTADSDGKGTVEEAFAYAAGVAGLDFFAVTDHSDSFDNDKNGALDMDGTALSQVWAAGKAAAAEVTDEDFVGIYGFEISWNQGQGHISTFNTPGWLSRDREGYEAYKDGMENYFDALLTVPGSISQFNHPGTFYGDFKDFSGYSPEADAQVTLIEVGNGAGSEYQTAYDYYTRALDKGWHLAPTNNQNNHEGNFGDASESRTVMLAAELTEQSIYDAMRNYRVYATEDRDLEIYYTLDGAVMGSELPTARVGGRAELVVTLFDPTDGELGTAEVIGPGGAVAASAPATGTVSFSLPSDAAYYYIRITQGDGDIAVTAPVWIRQAEDLGISRLETASPLTRVGEAQTINLEVFNNEAEPFTITSVTLTGDTGLALTWEGEQTVECFGTAAFSFDCGFETDGVRTVTATVRGSFAGEERVLTQTMEVEVLPKIVTSDVLIDGTHGAVGDYTELLLLAAQSQISIRIEEDAITAEQLSDCALLIIPAPERAFEPEFLEIVKNYVNRDGHILLLGTAGGSEELNRLLEAVGSEMRLNPDTARDEVSNGGSPEQLYTAAISESEWTEGVLEGQTFAHISGCTLTGGAWLVRRAAGEVLLASEGGILLSGSDFLADAYLKVPENPWAFPYANRTIAQNLLGITRIQPEIAPISQVRAGEVGSIYLIEGLVTAGTHNVNNDFPDTIYVQDDTGAIRAVGYSDHGLELGRRVRILGCLEEAEGMPILRILSMEILEKNAPPEPKTAANSLDYAKTGDALLKLQGTVTSVELAEGVVRSFLISDEEGNIARVWVEDYIFSGSLGWNHLDRIVQVGNRVSAVGLCYLLEGEPVLRIRDCDEVVLLWSPLEPTEPPTEAVTETTESPASTEPTVPETKEPPDTGTNPATGDTAFPQWAVVTLVISAGMLVVLPKSHKADK